MVFKTCLIQFSPIESKFLQDALLCKACKASKALNFDLYCLLGSGGREMWKPGRMKKTSHWMVRRQAMSGHVRPCQAMSFSEDVDLSMSLICFTAT